MQVRLMQCNFPLKPFKHSNKHQRRSDTLRKLGAGGAQQQQNMSARNEALQAQLSACSILMLKTTNTLQTQTLTSQGSEVSKISKMCITISSWHGDITEQVGVFLLHSWSDSATRVAHRECSAYQVETYCL